MRNSQFVGIREGKTHSHLAVSKAFVSCVYLVIDVTGGFFNPRQQSLDVYLGHKLRMLMDTLCSLPHPMRDWQTSLSAKGTIPGSGAKGLSIISKFWP